MLQEAVYAGHATVGGEIGPETERRQGRGALLRHDEVGRTGRKDLHPLASFGCLPPYERRTVALAIRVSVQGGGGLLFVRPRQHHGAAVSFAQELPHDGDAVGHGLSGAVHSLG